MQILTYAFDYILYIFSYSLFASYIGLFIVDWSSTGIMTSKFVICESESPWPAVLLVDSDFTNDEFFCHYPIHNYY